MKITEMRKYLQSTFYHVNLNNNNINSTIYRILTLCQVLCEINNHLISSYMSKIYIVLKNNQVQKNEVFSHSPEYMKYRTAVFQHRFLQPHRC